MYYILEVYCNKLLAHPNVDKTSYPKVQVIQEYKNRSRKAQENTVRALASLLGVNNWKDLINSN